MSDKSIKELTDEIGSIIGGNKPIGWPKPITTGVAKVNIKRRPNLLAQIEVPLHYAGTHWVTIDVYGETEVGGKTLSDMSCEINGEPADLILPESLKEQIANEILAGDHD